MKRSRKNRFLISIYSYILAFSLLTGCGKGTDADSQSRDAYGDIRANEQEAAVNDDSNKASDNDLSQLTLDDIPQFSGYSCVEINGNQPFFTEEEKQSTDSFGNYSDLDELGRCGSAYANLSQELMPTEKRGEIGSVKPSGWHTENYGSLVDGNYLYNRCHLIAYMLAGENANEKNLITGTRYLNVVGMLPFEFEVDDYINATGNHVLYRVTPMFDGDDLVARGVLMEAWSVEDSGEGICYNYFCYNIQPGIAIDYSTGDSWEDSSVAAYDNHPYNGGGNYSSDSQSQSMEKTDEAASQAEEASVNEKQDTGGGNVQESQTMVWISETGSKYHSKNNCGTMNPDKATQVTESKAQSMGLEKCKKCW